MLWLALLNASFYNTWLDKKHSMWIVWTNIAVFIPQTIFFTKHNVDEHSVKNENLSYWSNII